MRNNKKLFWAALGLAAFLGSTAVLWAAEPAVYCPVMPKQKINGKTFAEYKGQKIGLCCKSCLKKFNKNPEKYMKNLKS